MLAYFAAVLAGAGYVIDGSDAHTSAWLSPGALILAAVALLALHVAGAWPRSK